MQSLFRKGPTPTNNNNNNNNNNLHGDTRLYAVDDVYDCYAIDSD